MVNPHTDNQTHYTNLLQIRDHNGQHKSVCQLHLQSRSHYETYTSARYASRGNGDVSCPVVGHVHRAGGHGTLVAVGNPLTNPSDIPSDCPLIRTDFARIQFELDPATIASDRNQALPDSHRSDLVKRTHDRPFRTLVSSSVHRDSLMACIVADAIFTPIFVDD
jgi:hypothetical protein